MTINHDNASKFPSPEKLRELWESAIAAVEACDADPASQAACLARMKGLASKPLWPVAVFPDCEGLVLRFEDVRGHKFEHEFIGGVEEASEYDLGWKLINYCESNVPV